MRVSVVVAICAVAASAVAIGGALLQGDEGSAAPSSEAGEAQPPPLELDVLPGEPQAEALLAAQEAYAAGRLDQAADAFARVAETAPGSIEAAVGAAVAAWPDATVTELRRIVAEHPDSAVARLHLGLALAASGETEPARAEWRAAVETEPDTPSAVRADSLLHPDAAPGLPFFLSRAEVPARIVRLSPPEQLGALERRAENGGAEEHLALGALLQRLGRPVSAREAFDRAAELAPDSIQAQVASAVGRFSKDDPSQAFSRLGPLAEANPREAVIRFHLGLMLLWIRALDEAERQLTLAVESEPGSIYAREARKLLTTLAES
jgi:tetratricopeptide (TPR) repeat protein